MKGEIFRNTALDAKFKIVFMPNVVMATITDETVYLVKPSTGEKITCAMSKHATESKYPTTAGRKQIEVILDPLELLEKKILYQVVASENVLGFEGWGIVLSRAGSSIICDGFEREDFLPEIGQVVYLNESPFIVQTIQGTWVDRNSVLTLTLDKDVPGVGDVLKYGDIIKLSKGDKIYTVETSGIISDYYPADGANNVDGSVEIALATSETMSLESIKPSYIQLHHVKWIPEYVEDLSRLGDTTDPQAFEFPGGATTRIHEGHWADTAEDAFHMVKYSAEDTYNLSDYNFIVDQWLEYNKNGWVRKFGTTTTIFYYRLHKGHRWNDPQHIVKYFYVSVPEGETTPPQEPAGWESFDWSGITENNLCEECELVQRDASSKRFRTRDNLELVASGDILNKVPVGSSYYNLVIYRQGSEHRILDGQTIEIHDSAGVSRGRFSVLMANNDVVMIFTSDPGSDAITPGDTVWFVDPDFAPCTTCEMIKNDYEIHSEMIYETNYKREPFYNYDPAGGAGVNGDTPPPLYTDFEYGPPWIRECGDTLNYYSQRWHQNHLADGHGDGYHVVSYVDPLNDPDAFNPFKCQCCEWVNSYEVDRNFIKSATIQLRRVIVLDTGNELKKFLTNGDYHYMPNIKALFNFYEFRESYSQEEWAWLTVKGLETRPYPWKMNTALSYQDNIGSDVLPITSGSQYLIKVRPMTDMDLNWAKADEMQTDFQDPFLEDIPFPKILEPRKLLTGATYELFTSKDLTSIEGIREGIDTVVRFSVTPIIRSIYPEPDNLAVLPAELIEIELDGAVDLNTLTSDSIKLYFKNTSIEVDGYDVDYVAETITVGVNVLQINNMGKADMSLSGSASQYYTAEFTEGSIRLLYSNGDSCGDYFVEYIADVHPLTRLPRYRLLVYLCEDRDAVSITTLPFLIGSGYSVRLASTLGLTDGRILGYPKVWTFRTKQFIRWVSPVSDLENAPLACDVWLNFNYTLSLQDNIFFNNYTVTENQVIGRTSDTSSVYVISEKDILTLDITPSKSSRTILEEHLGEYDILKNFYKPGLITQVNDPDVGESVLWIKFDKDFDPLTNYFIVLETPIYVEGGGYTHEPTIFRFATNRFIRWTNPSAYLENVPLNSRMSIQFSHEIAGETLDESGVYVDKMFPPASDLNPNERYAGAVVYDEESFNASFLINMEVDTIDKDKGGKGKKTKASLGTFLNYPYNEDTRWLRLNVTPNVVDIEGETLLQNYEAPFTFHPFIRETVPNFGEQEVYCLIDKVEIYSNVGNLIHWDSIITDFPIDAFDPPRPTYRKTDGSGTFTEAARSLIYIENMTTREKIYFDMIRQECSGTINGYIGVPGIEAPSGIQQRTKLVCTMNNNEPLQLDSGQSYRIVISKDLLLNVGSETGGLPYQEEGFPSDLFNTPVPSLANNYGRDWESRFRTSLIEGTYPVAKEKGISLDVVPWIKFAEPLDESTIEDSRYELFKVPTIRKMLDTFLDSSTVVIQNVSDPLLISSKMLYDGDISVGIPLNTRVVFNEYTGEPFYLESFVDSSTFVIDPPLPDFISPLTGSIISFTPNSIRKRLVTKYYDDTELKTDYERGVNYFYLKNDISEAEQRTYQFSNKTLGELSMKIGTWFRVRSKKTFRNIYYVTKIEDLGATTRIEFWPRLEADTEAYDGYDRVLDEYMYIELYPILSPQSPTLSKTIEVGDRYIECTGFLNSEYLPQPSQWISFIDYSLLPDESEILEKYLLVDGYALSFEVLSISVRRNGLEISEEEVMPTDTVVIKLTTVSNVEIESGVSVLLAPMDYTFFLTGSVYLKNNLEEDEPFVPGKLEYDEDNYMLYFRPDEELMNSSIWIRECDYDSLLYNYSLFITTKLKTITGSSLLIPQEIPFKTWTYIKAVNPEDGGKSMPVFGTIRVAFKQSMSFQAGGPSAFGESLFFYDEDGNPYSNGNENPLNPFPFLPVGTGVVLSDRSYRTAGGGEYQLAVYASPRFEEGKEIYDRIVDEDILPELAKNGEYGEFVNGRIGPTFNYITGTPLLTWERCERVASNNPAAAGEAQYVRYSLLPDTLYKAVLRYRILKPADISQDDATGEALSFDMYNSWVCKLWEDKNYTWYFKTDKLVHSVQPEIGEEEVFSDEPIKVVFIESMNESTLKMESGSNVEQIVPDTEEFKEANTIYLWKDSSIVHKDEAGNVLYTQERRTKIPCAIAVGVTDAYPEHFVGNYTDNYGTSAADFSAVPVYLSTGKRHMLYKKQRTIVTLYPRNELSPGTVYHVSISDKVETQSGVKYFPGFEFDSSFKTSELVRKVSLETDLSADLVYDYERPPYYPKYLKIMFHRHLDPDSIGAQENPLIHDSFSRISVHRLPVDPVMAPPPSPKAHVSYRDNIQFNPVPESGQLMIPGDYYRNGGSPVPGKVDDDSLVNIWAEWRPFNPGVLEAGYRSNTVDIRITIGSSIKSVPYIYDESYGDYRVARGSEEGDKIFSLPFGLQKIITRRIKFIGNDLVLNKLSMVYPSPQQYIQNNPTFEVYGVPRQLEGINIEYFNPLLNTYSQLLPYFWPVSLIDKTSGDMIQSVDFNFTDQDVRQTVEMTLDQNTDRLLNAKDYSLLIWPVINMEGTTEKLTNTQKGTNLIPLRNTDTSIILSPQQTLTNHKYLIVNRNTNGSDPLMVKFSTAVNSTITIRQNALTSFETTGNIIVASNAIYNSVVVGGEIMFMKTGQTNFYSAHTVTSKTNTAGIRRIFFTPAIESTTGFQLFFWSRTATAGTITNHLVTTVTITQRLNTQTGTIIGGTNCYVYGYAVNYHINNLIEHVAIEWEVDRYVMWIVFANGATVADRPGFNAIQTWYNEGKISIQRAGTPYTFVVPVETFDRFILGTADDVKVLKITPRVTSYGYIRRPWFPWPNGGFSPETSYKLVMNKNIASQSSIYICGQSTVSFGVVSGTYDAGATSIAVVVSIIPTVGKHIIINGWSYIVKSFTSTGGSNYTLVLTSGLIDEVDSGDGILSDAANFYNADFIQTLVCPAYPAIEKEPICKTSAKTGGCATYDTGVYEMSPAPYSDNVDVNSQIIITFTDPIVSLDMTFLGLYVVPGPGEESSNIEDFLVPCRVDVDYGNGIVTMLPGKFENIPLLSNREYYVGIKKSVTSIVIGVPVERGIRLRVLVEEQIDESDNDNWLDQAVLIEEVDGSNSLFEKITSIKTSGWSYSSQPRQGDRIRLLSATDSLYKSYTIEYIENVWINSGSVIILHLVERIYSTHEQGTIQVLRQPSQVEEERVLDTDCVFSFETGEGDD